MKKIIALITGCMVLCMLHSCQNQDTDFPDFDYTSTYFPNQYPVRTLILGDYYFDNTNDNELKFVISAAMGGVYENTKDRIVNFVIDESLTENLYLNGKRIQPLPSHYYTLSDNSKMVIPKGEKSGGIYVQLTEAFLDDPDAISKGMDSTVYVVPLRITGAETDSIRSGTAIVASPDRRKAADWEIQPMDFTLFGITYVNEYHGNYLMCGQSFMYQNDQIVDTVIYKQKYMERNRVISVNTISRNTIVYTKEVARKTGSSPGNFIINITFNSDGTGHVETTAASDFPVTGTAKFVKNAESWGGEARHTIYLDYQVNDGTYINRAKDTLVFRDKGISFQDYSDDFVLE